MTEGLDLAEKFFDRLIRSSLPILAVIVIGSAVRPEDFIDGLSDVDVVIVCRRADSMIRRKVREIASSVDPALSPLVLSHEGLKDIFAVPIDLAFLIRRGKPLLLDDRTRRIISSPVEPDDDTARRLKASARGAVRLAFEDAQLGDLEGGFNHAYHALRHAIRYRSATKGHFPVSDSEVLRAVSDVEKVRKLFAFLVSLRHRHAQALRDHRLIMDVIGASDRLVDSILGEEKIASVDDLARFRYAEVICYPKPSLKEVLRRIRQLRRLAVEAIEFVGDKSIDDLRVLGKGCVSVVVVGRKKDRRFALKIRRTDADRENMDHEAKMQRIANSVNVGPRLQGYTDDFIVMELIEGKAFPAWIVERREDRDLVKGVIADALIKCRKLDEVGLDHGELSRAPKHLIVDGKNRPRIIDFETASSERRPKNVTSIVQYFYIKGDLAKSVQRLVGKVGRQKLIGALKAYKKDPTRQTFERILDICHLGPWSSLV